MSTIAERLQTDMVAAMKAKEAEKLSTIRMLKTALMEAKTAKPKDATLTEDEAIEILQRYVKKRRETIETNLKVGRPDLNAAEEFEIAITQAYLPEMVTEDALTQIVKDAVASTGAAGPKDMGRVMAALKEQYAGQMDFGRASGIVKHLLKCSAIPEAHPAYGVRGGRRGRGRT